MGGFAAARLSCDAVHEVLIHHDLAAMCVEVALSELHRLAEHNPHVDLRDGKLGELIERFADEVAVLDKGLEGEFGEGVLEVLLALSSRIDDDGVCTQSHRYICLADDRGNEGLEGEGLDDARSTDDGDPIDDAEARVEGLAGQLSSHGNTDGDVDTACGVVTAYDRLHHRTRCLVDGGASYLQPKPREGDDAYALTLKEADAFVLCGEGDFGANLCQMCDIGVIA